MRDRRRIAGNARHPRRRELPLNTTLIAARM
jgi:hypothetical protein